MTLVVPSPLPGAPRTSQGKGDGAQALRNIGEVDFVAALAEKAGQASEDSGGEEVAAKMRETAGPPPRAVHRLGVRDGRDLATANTKDTKDTKDRVATAHAARTDQIAGAEVASQVDTAGLRSDIHSDVVAKSNPAGSRDSPTPIAVEGAPPLQMPETAPAGSPAGMTTVLAAMSMMPAPQDMPPRADPARDALAVLDVGRPNKRDMVATAAEFTTPLPRQPLPAGSAPVSKRAEPVLGEAGAFDGPDLPGDMPNTIAATPVRVVRQETHFQPVAFEARRHFGMTHTAPDDRMLPLSLAATTKLTRPPRESQAAPTVSDPVVGAADPLAPASIAGPESPTLGNIGQQLADGVQRALGAPAERSMPRSVSPADPAAPPAYAPVLRSIKLQLNPVSLGVVTIVLTGSEGEMRVHLEAERAETFGRVEQERGAISARLNGAGYAITELTVGRMGAADTAGRDGDQREPGTRQGGQSGGQSGAQQGEAAGGGARDGGGQFADQRAGRHPGERATRADGLAASIATGTAAGQVVSGVSYAGRFRPV